MIQRASPILSHRSLASDFYEVVFEWGCGHAPVPGQFLTVRVADSTVPLLRRPFAFSAFDTAAGSASFIYQRRGPATQLLSGMRVGETLDVIGPLGTPFPVPGQGTRCLLVAGGIGLGPMLFVARTLAARAFEVRFLFGCRSQSLMPDSDLFEGIAVDLCTDDGSAGHKGTTVDLLRTLDLAGTEIFACGPTPMLRGCHEVAQSRGRTCWVSMEQVMACGVGACMGCVVKVKSEAGYARVCKEGPVFDSREIVWE